MSLVLIVDDVPAMRQQYAYDLQRLGGHETATAASGAEAIQMLETEPVDCVILDLEMPGIDGFEVLRTMTKRRITVPVIVYTGTGNYDRCVRAVKLGAYSFVDKEEPLERVAREVENALAYGRLHRQVADLRRRAGDDAELVGESRVMCRLKEQIDRLAPIPSTVLIDGESGTGKELVARGLHRLSGRKADVFVPVNCAALPDHLVESELFGHERGTFTGADKTRKGAFEIAGGGTLFLDEIGELPAPAQAKLLRVLEDGKVTRLGSSRPLAIDARVVAATNRDLSAEVAAGRFREDLLFRLNIHTVHVPPLRERQDDIPLLTEHFLQEICARFGIKPKTIAAEAVGLLEQYQWRRNNVRELRNVVERLVIATDADVIVPGSIPPELQSAPSEPAADGDEPGGDPTGPATLKELKNAAERKIILAALQRNAWHVTRTASQLGLADHASLLKIMRRHGIKRP